MTDARRRALVAALLSVVGAAFGVAGAGHAYLREWRRAFAWFAFVVGASAVLIVALADPETATPATLPLRVTVPLGALLTLNALDAYYVARRAGRPGAASGGEGSTPRCRSCGRDLDPELSFCPWCAGVRDGGEGRE